MSKADKMFCRVLEKAFHIDNMVNVSNKTHANELRKLYVGKIFVVKKIDSLGQTYFYIDQDHRDSLAQLLRIYKDPNHVGVPQDFYPFVRKTDVKLLTFVDIWELKRNGTI